MRVPDEIMVPKNVDDDRVTRLEQRIARLEAHLGITGHAAEVHTDIPPPALAPVFRERAHMEEEFEVELGQHWFALAGIVIMTAGGAFLLSLPFANLPAGAPSLVGYAVVAALFTLAHAGRRSFELVAGYVRGAGMVLLYMATLRLCFPTSRHLLDVDSGIARALLIATVALNLWIGLRRKSPWLTGIALATGGLTVLLFNAHWLAFGALVLLAVIAVVVSEREKWRVLSLGAMAGVYAIYLAWALGLGSGGAALHFATSPAIAPAVLLACTFVFASGLRRPPKVDAGGAWEGVHAFANCALGYGIFLVHTMAAFPSGIALSHTLAFLLFLGIAIAFWMRHQSRAATFFYAMTGYVALSLAILKVARAPDVFVWLSVQSVVVVATAIWFRSRFIVVANFFIFAAIVVAYMVLTSHESGISLGFGVVALVTARILNWKQHRLELKTELMRNTYLVSAFVIFPYAAYHLVAAKYVALVWTALAAAYYVMNLMVKNQKYRWMGHGTLVLATIYVIGAGVSRFEPVYRVVSFLALGTLLLIVSLLFTRAHRSRKVAIEPVDANRSQPE